jgi:hypothetical protein
MSLAIRRPKTIEKVVPTIKVARRNHREILKTQTKLSPDAVATICPELHALLGDSGIKYGVGCWRTKISSGPHLFIRSDSLADASG